MSAIDRFLTSARIVLAAPLGQKFLDPKMNVTEDPDKRADIYDVIQCLATNIIQNSQKTSLRTVTQEIFSLCPPKFPKDILENREHLRAILSYFKTPSESSKIPVSWMRFNLKGAQITSLFFRVTQPLFQLMKSSSSAELEHFLKMSWHRYELQRVIFLLTMQAEWFSLHSNSVAMNNFLIPKFIKQLPESVAEAIVAFGFEKERTPVEYQSCIFEILKPLEPQSEIGKALFIRLFAKKPPNKKETFETLISRNLLVFFAKSEIIQQIRKTKLDLSKEYVEGLEELHQYAKLLLTALHYSTFALDQVTLKKRMQLMKTARDNLLAFITASTFDAKGNREDDFRKRLDDLVEITPFLFNFKGWSEKEETTPPNLSMLIPVASVPTTHDRKTTVDKLNALQAHYIDANAQASYQKIWYILKSEETFAKSRKIDRTMTGTRYLGSVDTFMPAFSAKNSESTSGYAMLSTEEKELRIFHEKEEAFFLDLQMTLYGTHQLLDYETWVNRFRIILDIGNPEDLLDAEMERTAVEKAIQFLEHSQSTSIDSSMSSSTEAAAGAGAASASSHPISESEASSDEVDEDFTSMVSPLDLSKEEEKTSEKAHKYDPRILRWWEDPGAILSSKTYRDLSEDERRFQEAAHTFPLYIDERLIPRNSKESPSPYCIVGDWMIKKEKHVCYMIPGEILMDGKVFRGAFEITVDRRGIIYHRHFVRETEKQSLFEVLHTTKHWPGELPNIKEAALPPAITEDEKGLKVAESSFGTIRMTTPKGVTYVLYRAR